MLIDPKIRTWVILPIMVIAFLFYAGRHFAALYLTSRTVDLKKIAEGHILTKSRMLRANGNFIPSKGFAMRKKFLNAEETGILKEAKKNAVVPNPLSDPNQMNNMMKNTMVGQIPMMIVGPAVQWAFAGFVIVRVPFSLTPSFKSMLQMRISGLDALGSSWVSAFSFYYLCLSGLSGIFQLVLGRDSDSADQSKLMQQQMNMGGAQADSGKAFQNEWDNLEVMKHKWALDGVEADLLRVLRPF